MNLKKYKRDNTRVEDSSLEELQQKLDELVTKREAVKTSKEVKELEKTIAEAREQWRAAETNEERDKATEKWFDADKELLHKLYQFDAEIQEISNQIKSEKRKTPVEYSTQKVFEGSPGGGLPEEAPEELVSVFDKKYLTEAHKAGFRGDDADFKYSETDLGEAVGFAAVFPQKPSANDIEDASEDYGILYWYTKPVKVDNNYWVGFVAGV